MMTLNHSPRYRQTDVVILRQIMDRAGLQMSPEAFILAVQKAFLGSRERSLGEQLVKAFRECPSFVDFKGALSQAQKAAPGGCSILVIGAGQDVPGRDSAYASQAVREVFGESANVTRLDLTPETIYTEPERRYDVVVTHSLPHYFFDQESFYGFVRACTKPGGCYVMGNEPNRRFWVNPEVQKRFHEMNAAEYRRRTVRYYLNPRHYAAKMFRVLSAPKDESFSLERSVNLILQKSYNAQAPLTLKEMNRITDPFFPDELPGDHPLGGNGIDWDKDVPSFLRDFKLEWIASARHMGKHNPKHLPEKWQKVNAELKARHPMDGNVFSALWRRLEA